MWFVTWVGGLACTLIATQLFCALHWCVSAAVSGMEVNDDMKYSLHAGMAVIAIIGYLFLSGGVLVYGSGG